MSDYLDNGEEVLFRHIHPDFFQDGQPSESRFRPSKQDLNKLSLDRRDVHDVATSHYIYTYGGRQSVAVYGISVSEFGEHNIFCTPDPTEAKEATETTRAQLENKAHTLADYSTYSDKEQKVISKKLKLRAIARGKLFPE